MLKCHKNDNRYFIYIYICILFKQKKAFGFDVFRKRRIQS